MKILRKLLRYFPITRGRLMDMEVDLIEFIDISQEHELIMRNDLRNLLSALMQHARESNGSSSKTKQDDKDDEVMFG